MPTYSSFRVPAASVAIYWLAEGFGHWAVRTMLLRWSRDFRCRGASLALTLTITRQFLVHAPRMFLAWTSARAELSNLRVLSTRSSLTNIRSSRARLALKASAYPLQHVEHHLALYVSWSVLAKEDERSYDRREVGGRGISDDSTSTWRTSLQNAITLLTDVELYSISWVPVAEATSLSMAGMPLITKLSRLLYFIQLQLSIIQFTLKPPFSHLQIMDFSSSNI